MRNAVLFLGLILAISCGDHRNDPQEEERQLALKACESKESEEAQTRQFIETYIQDLNSLNWETKVPRYLQADSDAFLREHAAFRVSFPNYKAKIKHLTVEGNRCIVWINIRANYAKTYDFEGPDNDHRDGLLKGIAAENQRLSWDETWYFDVVDGKFGPEWDFLKDNYAVLQGLKEHP